MTTIVSSGTTTVNFSTSSGYLVESSGTLNIVNGGLVSGNTTVIASGIINVSSGGIVALAAVSSGGRNSRQFPRRRGIRHPLRRRYGVRQFRRRCRR